MQKQAIINTLTEYTKFIQKHKDFNKIHQNDTNFTICDLFKYFVINV